MGFVLIFAISFFFSGKFSDKNFGKFQKKFIFSARFDAEHLPIPSRTSFVDFKNLETFSLTINQSLKFSDLKKRITALF